MGNTDVQDFLLSKNVRSVHDRALLNIAKEYLNDPDWLETVAMYLRNMRNGVYSKDAIDVVFQNWDRFGEYTFVDAVAYMLIHTDIHLGKIAKTVIDIGCEPSSDTDRDSNSAALMKGLESINAWGTTLFDPNSTEAKCRFFGNFWGGSADEDGYIEWDGNASFWIFKDGKCDHDIKIPGRRVPLEVGYTMPGRTIAHLASARGLARWPYNSKIITILVVVDNDIWRLKYDNL